jgi:PKD repeat protein
MGRAWDLHWYVDYHTYDLADNLSAAAVAIKQAEFKAYDDLVHSRGYETWAKDPGYQAWQRRTYFRSQLASPQPPNTPPTAAFSWSCTDLTCSFTDQSSDSDGSISSRTWNFGDGASSTAVAPSHKFTAGGTYNVSLVVVDNGGAASSTTTHSVTVTAPPPSPNPTNLTVASTKSKSTQFATLQWVTGTASWADVYRNGTKLARTANSGSYSDPIGSVAGKKGASTTYTYRVCIADSQVSNTNCSNTASLTF